jgi:hypothetical protein
MLTHIIKGLLRTKRLIARTLLSRSIRKMDPNDVPTAPHEVRLFAVVRNESLRLPYMLKYYFSLGVDRMFIIDHSSTDETASFLSRHKNVHLFRAEGQFDHKTYWLDMLLHRYGEGHWCILVDGDELLTYPHMEKLRLQQLTSFLERKGYDAVDFLLLDMYPERSLDSITYRESADPLSVAPFFDPISGDLKTDEPYGRPLFFLKGCGMVYTGIGRMYGGMRKRVFGIDPCLSKFSLFKFNNKMFIGGGAHFIEGARIADIRGALLHFKYLNDFPDKVREEVSRKEHWDKAAEYRAYLQALDNDSHLKLHSSSSIKFIDSVQLIRLGIMKSSPDLDDLVKEAVSS